MGLWSKVSHFYTTKNFCVSWFDVNPSDNFFKTSFKILT